MHLVEERKERKRKREKIREKGREGWGKRELDKNMEEVVW